MSDKKPSNIEDYKKWLKDKHGAEISPKAQTYYESVTTKIQSDLKKSIFWKRATSNLREYHDEYYSQTGYALLTGFELELLIKPFDSFLLKTFRKNVVENKNWPDPPQEGWVLPNNWHSKISDTVRTLIVVKYLDGVEFVIDRLKLFCEQEGVRCNPILEARSEGYYAAHVYMQQSFEIPKPTWDTERIDVSIELQVTTQPQEVIRKLLHTHYEQRRVRPKEDKKWQWNYRSDEFTANYLGHILHYVEGMIMDVREKQKAKEKIP